MIFAKKKILVWCDDPPEDPVISIFAGCLANHDRAHSHFAPFPQHIRSKHQQEFPDLTRMTRQYLSVPVTSVSPDRFFSRVGLVQTDLRGRLLDTTMIDLMWAKFPLCLTHQYIRSTVKLATPHTWSYLTNYQPC